MGRRPSRAELKRLNGEYSIGDELRREDEVARTVLTVAIAGAVASASVSAASGIGQFGPLFLATGGAFLVPAATVAVSLAVSGIARDDEDDGPWEAIGEKRTLNRIALAALFLVLYSAGVAGFLIALV